MPQAMTYGPYYKSAIRQGESQKKAMGGTGYTPEQLAALSYGELMARYSEDERRREAERQYGLQKKSLGLNATQIGTQQKALGQAQAGQMVAGIATGVNVLDKLGVLSAGKEAATNLMTTAKPGFDEGYDFATTFAPGTDIVSSGIDYGLESYDEALAIGDTLSNSFETAVSSGGTVICTELYHQGLLDEKTYRADSAFGKTLDEDILNGYHLWGEKIAQWMGESRWFTRLVSVFAKRWATEMAFRMGVGERGNWMGKAMNYVGIPICRGIGRIMTRRLRWQIC